MHDSQAPRRAKRPETREHRPTRRRKSGIRIPFGSLLGLAACAVLLQWSGVLDLGLPIGFGPDRAPTPIGGRRPASVADAQTELRDMVSSAARLVDAGGGSPEPPEPSSSSRPEDAGDTGLSAHDPSAGDPEASTAQAVAGPDAAAGAAPASAGEPPGEATVSGARSDGYRSEVERAWFTAGGDLADRAVHARTRALQLGAVNYEAASRALVAPATEGQDLERIELAARLSPDLPLARMELGAAYFEDGQYLYALREVVAGVAAIPRNLEATAWLAASLLAMFAVVLTIGSLVFIVWVGISVFRHAAHDVGDLVSRQMPEFARAALLGCLLLVPVLMGEALMGVVAALFLLGFSYCEAGYRRALALAAVLLMLGAYPVTRLAGMALTALDSDPVAAAAHAVVRSTSSSADLEILRAAADDDWLAEVALALHERRAGDSDAARARYEQLLERFPTDPVVLATLSNMYFERGENERAIELGQRAAAVAPSATLLFNLSQVYARSFRMEEFESAMAQAQHLDAGVVAELSRAKAPDFVADPGFPVEPLRDRMIQAAGGDRFVDPVSRLLMPGRIGHGWKNTAATFAAAALLGLVLGGRWEHASTCQRCGRRICGRCDGTVWNSRICDGCHHLFHRPESTDPAMRMARLSALRAREGRIARLATAASVLLPGVGGLLARRPDLSFLGLFFFVWAVLLLLWHDGVVVDPLAVGAAGPLLFVTGAGVAVLAYLLVVTLGLVIRRKL